jgi:hypothetical protein
MGLVYIYDDDTVASHGDGMQVLMLLSSCPSRIRSFKYGHVIVDSEPGHLMKLAGHVNFKLVE